MAEQIVNEFTVNRPIDEAWPIICDIERIAPCLPGAQLEEVEGDVYRGKVKVKLGAVTAEFKGEAHLAERDDDTHHAVLKAKGRDIGGRGNAEADIAADAEALSPTSTRCVVKADLHITGKVAQFGRGIMADVSKKLMDQFAANLNTMLDEQGATQPEAAADTTPPSGPAEGAPAASDAGAARAADADAFAEEPPTVRKINGPAAEPVDLAGVAGPAVVKRLVPALLALLLIVLLLRRRGK
jgi:carbon monoxide dehydrogenase subunit G